MQKIFLIIITLFSCSQKELIYQVPETEEERILSDENLDEIIQIIRSGDFKSYNQKNNIPKEVLKALAGWQNGKVRFASHGKKYRKGCVVTNQRIPSREITTILKSEKYFIMTYNHGGRGFHRHILFCKLKSGEIAKNIWVGNSSKELTDKDEIIEELEKKI